MPKTNKPKTQLLKVEKNPEIEGKCDFKVLYNSHPTGKGSSGLAFPDLLTYTSTMPTSTHPSMNRNHTETPRENGGSGMGAY